MKNYGVPEGQTEWFRALIEFCKDPPALGKWKPGDESKKYMRRIAANNLMLQQDLNTLLEAFNRNSTDTVVLKGAHFIEKLYPPGIRPVSDIDLLIRKKDIPAAAKILKNMGYRVDTKGVPFWMQRDIANKLTYYKKGISDIPLDIHFSLGPYPYLGKIKPELIWEKALPAEIAGAGTKVMNPVHTLLHQCLHLFQHREENWLTSCCDIAVLVKSTAFCPGWDDFIKSTGQFRLGQPVVYSLKKVNEVFGDVIPVEILTLLSGSRATPSEKKVFRLLNGTGDIHHKYLKTFVQFKTTPGIIIKACILLQIILPNPGILVGKDNDDEKKRPLKDYIFYYFKMLKLIGRLLGVIVRRY